MPSETPSRTPIIVAIIGLAATMTVALVANFWRGGPQIDNQLPSPTPTAAPARNNPEQLIDIIKEQQRKHVRESYGEAADENFTSRDLERFTRENTTQVITEELKKNGEFINIVLAIKALPPHEQQKLLDSAMNTYKPTWTELGKIHPQGQTDAGQRAEKMVAEAIVALVRELLQLPAEDIKNAPQI